MQWIVVGVIIAMVGGTSPGRGEGAVVDVNDWRKAAAQGWVFADRRQGGRDGRISLQGGVLRLADEGDGPGDGAEVTHPGPFVVGERFALLLKARFLRIGRDDDSTGGSQFRLQIGVRSPQGDYGVGFRFSADRYLADSQYKVYRTDDAWHDWRFEVDTIEKTVAMFRDGEYVCLHRAGGPQPAGARLQVQGTAQVPTVVDIARLALLPLPPKEAPARAARPRLEVEPQAGEWPLWRRDLRNSGFSPLQGDLRHPRIAWQFEVGGPAAVPVFLDLDGDGEKELLISYGGNLSALKRDGSPLWQQRRESASIHGMWDLDEDGEQELIISAGAAPQVQVLRARDGKTLYHCGLFPQAGVAGVRVAKLDPGKRGLQAIVWSPQHEIGFCLSFAEGAANACVDWMFNWQVTNFHPQAALADMDRDGLLELVVITYGHVFVFDGRTGELQMELEWSSGRNYGTLVLKDVDADGYPDVVMLADQLREHIAVIKNEEGKSLRLLWDSFYEQNYPEDRKSLRVLNESVDDFDGDGRIEVAYALYDGTADAQWHTLIADAITGTIKQDIPQRYLVGAGPFFPNRPPALLLSQPSSRDQLQLTRLAFWSGQGGRWQELAALPEGLLLTARSFRDFQPFTWSMAGTPTTVLRSLGSSGEQNGLFMVRLEGEAGQTVEYLQGDARGRVQSRWRYSLPTGLASGSVADVQEIIPGGDPEVVFVGSDGVLRLLGVQGIVLAEMKTGGFIAVPVVARLRPHEPPSILFLNAYRTLHCLRLPATGQVPERQWSCPAVGMRVRYVSLLSGSGIPAVVDLDGDGEREILMAQEPNRLVALDARGEVKRAWTFPALPVQWTWGNFDGDEALDLFVTYERGAFVDLESVAVAGRDGKVLWSSHCGNGPPAILDVDGDGLDEVILRDLFEHRTLSGRDGRDLYPITMWAGYHTPVVVPLDGEDHPSGIVWVGGNYSLVVEALSGEQHWWTPFKATGPQAVADVDGDGRLEVGGVTAGQLYNWPDFYAVEGPHQDFVCYDARTGAVEWSYPLGTITYGVVAADVDGDGRAEFVLGTSDGRLIALRGTSGAGERVVWEIAFPAAVGMPVVCDVDDDGRMEILVGCANGMVYCVE